MSSYFQPVPAQSPDDFGFSPAQIGEAVSATVVSRLADYAELFKVRITSLVMMTAWAGFFLATRKSGVSALSWTIVEMLFGIGLVSGGASGINQVMERFVDARMLRTRNRPLPAHRMSTPRAAIVSTLAIIGGSLFLAYTTNPLSGLLTFATAVSYIFLYTPLKQISPISTFVGAFPGAMPPLIGWTAVRGELEWEALALFAILFFWQFPHFLAIAWLYREDYQRAGIRMLPVVDKTGKATVLRILAYGVGLVPVSMSPAFLNMSGGVYLICAGLMSIAYLWHGVKLARLNLPPSAPQSKQMARHLLRASIIYLPVLLTLMILTGAH